MHLLRLWFALGLVAACVANAAVIYKWTDADGVVHYSDQAVPGAEKIVTSSSSSNGIAVGAARGPSIATSSKKAPSRLDYAAFAIESPAKEQVFYGDEVIPVRLRLDPDLKANQTIGWYLNGSPLTDQAPTSRAFTLQSLSRGTYQISATLTDIVTGETQNSEGVTFFVRQPSELSPQHRKP
jgi:membrane carboxypeptidase/penicillin-binding protein PbpC